MRCEIVLKERLLGFACGAAKSGETVSVSCSEFLSSEDGSRFISRLEGLQGCLISLVPGCPPPSQIDSFLAIIRHDLHATIFVNEVNATMHARPKRGVKPGQAVILDDIADIVRLDVDPAIPDDCALVLIKSFGWRKSLFFDLSPLELQPTRRQYDLGQVLGFQHAYLLFQEQLQISDAQWEELFGQSWFPFRFLPGETLKSILNHAREKWDIDVLLEDDNLLAELDTLAEPSSGLLTSAPFANHKELIAHAFERFRARDFRSVVAVLFPRIEGVLRSVHAKDGAGKPTASALVASSTAAFERARGEAILLMPAKFREYLDQVYFKKWNPGDAAAHVSRHTVSHGVAPEELFNKKSAVLAVLILLQLCLYF